MGFLRKIFRRKNDPSNHTNSISPTSTLPNDAAVGVVSSSRKSSWRNSGKGGHTNGAGAGNGGNNSLQRPHQLVVREDSPTQLIMGDDLALMAPIVVSGTTGNRRVMRGPDESDGTQRPILSPRNLSSFQNTSGSSSYSNNNNNNNASRGEGLQLKITAHRSSAPVDLDDSQSESMIESIHSREQPPSTTESLEPPRSSTSPNHNSSNSGSRHRSSSAPIFTMPDTASGTNSNTMMLPKLRFSAGNVSVGSHDDTDGESSSFNLSTDAEDTEYEAMRQRLGATGMMMLGGGSGSVGTNGHSNNMDMSVANYTTDGETSVFPGLQSEDDATQTTASVTKEAAQNSILHLPTVNPATGASLVPVGYGNHPYAGAVGFPGAAAYHQNGKSSHENRLSNGNSKLNVEESNHRNNSSTPTNGMNGMIKPREEVSRFNDDKAEMAQPARQSWIGHRSTTPTNYNSSTSGAVVVPPLELSKRDSPDPKNALRSSPKVASKSAVSGTSIAASNHPTNDDNHNASLKPYSSKMTDPVYGSSTAANGANSKNHHRSFTSPKKGSSEKTPTTVTADFDPFTMDNTTGFTSSNDMDLFADFADFSNFDNAFRAPSSTPVPQPAVVERVGRTAASPFIDRPEEKPRITRHTSVGSTGTNSHHQHSSNNGNHHRKSLPASTVISSAVHNDTSLSELLEKAKSKSSRSGGSHAKKTSTSVNSAPAHMTASYLRQHHNLGNKSRSTKGGDGASVTDIIQSLEAANATRLTSGSSSNSLGNGRHGPSATNGGNLSRDDGFSSAHSREGGSSVMSAKEKIRRRRERRHQRGGDAHSSDSENEHEDNESWLFDEVTGALGPRGIAADLESLSGRSNRSSSSRGNKSHRSHRSHKSGSRSSRHRRPKTDSADSVDSHHSRDSRRSRGSRYSHRSTRSYISQMSEQSRSVANDLLRLEMQLAMVGSAGVPGLDGGSSSVGGIVRNTRSLSSRSTPPVTTPLSVSSATSAANGSRRMATARRSRITIQAPAGRLGIILANKADARGTVVSGVRSNSALVDRITPGDRIVAIDGEDVSLMTVSEITTIMARKADFERILTVLTTPRHTESTSNTNGMNSPRSSSDAFQQHK